MSKKIKKWGNSLAVRIPKKTADDFNLHENSEIEIKKSKKGIIIEPKRKKLKDLVDKVNDKNRHDIQFPEDKPKGKEVW